MNLLATDKMKWQLRDAIDVGSSFRESLNSHVADYITFPTKLQLSLFEISQKSDVLRVHFEIPVFQEGWMFNLGDWRGSVVNAFQRHHQSTDWLSETFSFILLLRLFGNVWVARLYENLAVKLLIIGTIYCYLTSN